MGSNYHQETIIRTFQSLDAFRDTNMTELDIDSNWYETSFILDGVEYFANVLNAVTSISVIYIFLSLKR
jgi:hypothetical protein